MTGWVELHCHLDGLLDIEMLEDLATRGVTLPVDEKFLRSHTPVRGKEAFWRWFQGTRALEGRLDAYRPIVALQLERWVAQDVRYAELMIGSSEIPKDHEEMKDRVGAFRAWLDTTEAGRLEVELLVAFGRNRGAAEVDEIVGRLIVLHETGWIAGVALAGPEEGHPVRPFRKSFERLFEAGVPVEIHAGEWCGPESVWDALEHGMPRRLGHSVGAFSDPKLLAYLKERQIHVEFCPTSNVRTGSIPDAKQHPVGQAWKLGLHFSLNTDDPGPFGCSLASEVELVQRTFDLDDRAVEKIMAQAREARFVRAGRAT
jgi:adenosine deaminase